MAEIDPASLPGISKSVLSKIVPLSEVVSRIGERPRETTIVVCHGVFDIVHPGHLQLLLNAKQRGEILVAGVISDSYLTEEQGKAKVNEQVRAMGLAALECVDFVVIDDHSEPTSLIESVKPDLFSTGFSYFEATQSASLEAVQSALDKYGGELLFNGNQSFTSRTRSTNVLPQNFSPVKLALSLKAEGLTLDQISTFMDHFPSLSVHVVGDSYIDAYLQCRIGGPSPKTPSVSMEFEREERFLGGAARVAVQLAKAGAKTTLSTLLGDDQVGAEIYDKLTEAGVQVHRLVDPHRKTSENLWYYCRDQRVFQVRKTDSKVLPPRLNKELEGALRNSTAHACVFVDSRLGMLNSASIPNLISALPQSTLKVADCQSTSRWGNILDYKGVDVITPNLKEAQYALGDQDSILKSIAHELLIRAKCQTLMLKVGSNGVLVFRQGARDRAFFSIDSFAGNVVDPVGAGDVYLAYATLGLLVSRSEFAGAFLGSIAAAVRCSRFGYHLVSQDEIRTFIPALQTAMDAVQSQIDKVLVDA